MMMMRRRGKRGKSRSVSGGVGEPGG